MRLVNRFASIIRREDMTDHSSSRMQANAASFLGGSASACSSTAATCSQPAPRLSELQAVAVAGASSLVLLFSADTRLASGSTLSVYYNESCTSWSRAPRRLRHGPLFLAQAWLLVSRPQVMVMASSVWWMRHCGPYGGPIVTRPAAPSRFGSVCICFFFPCGPSFSALWRTVFSCLQAKPCLLI